MREKLNDNPMAQVALIGILVVAAAVMFLKPMGGGEEEETTGTTEATVSVAGSEASGTATGASPGEAVEAAVEGALEAAGAEAPAAVASAIPAPPMPAPVARAYDAGKTVVLLVVHDDGIDDRLVRGTIGRVEAFPDVALFVVPAKQIARYAAITLGVQVQQVPALVTLRPRGLSGEVPQASVDYGFQTAQSVVQAVVDARYKGPEATYHPD